MKSIFIFFLNFYLFFYIYPINIFAQQFNPSIDLFNSELDGFWEIGLDDDSYQVKEKNSNYQKEINFNINESHLSDFLVGNSLEIDFSIDRKYKDFLFNFSFICSTDEYTVGFDQPFLIVYLGDELIFKESNLFFCDEEKTHYFLLPNNNKKIYFFYGETGDLENKTTVEIEDINLSVKEDLIFSSPTPIIKKDESQTKLEKINYPSFSEIHNFNEKKPLVNDDVLGVTDEKKDQSFIDSLPDYFPFLVGIFVFIITFPVFTLLSFLFDKLKNRKEKNE
jgi:hypothetical protein